MYNEDQILIIKQTALKKAIEVLKQNEIPFEIPGYPDGKVSVTIEYPSKINTHAALSDYAKSKGYNSLIEAIDKNGGARAFKEMYRKEMLR